MNQEKDKNALELEKVPEIQPEPEKIVDKQVDDNKTSKVLLPVRLVSGCDGDCADPGIGGTCMVELTPRKSDILQVSIRVV
jgi:hypothetical protein